MDQVRLTHLTYCSAAVPGLSSSDLKDILRASQIRNSQLSVTGMLLYTSGSFFQVLEGDETVLSDLFGVIASDRRHTDVTMIIHEPIARRDFGNWTMGFAELSASELAGVEGLSDFFQQGDSLTKLSPGRAKKLLEAFARGRWRARLEEDTE